jgi:hypothetical protein
MSSPFTALFESLHSAWIDELTERFPEPKPELGMPMRFSELKAPVTGLAQVVRVDVEIGGKKGVALLALSQEAASNLGCDSQSLWEALAARSQREFEFRKVQPILGQPQVFRDEGWATKKPEGFSRLIWVPVSLDGAACFLGVGA